MKATSAKLGPVVTIMPLVVCDDRPMRLAPRTAWVDRLPCPWQYYSTHQAMAMLEAHIEKYRKSHPH